MNPWMTPEGTWSKCEIGMTKMVMIRAAITSILKNQNPLWMAARTPLLEVTPIVTRHMARKKNPTENET